MLKTDKEHTKEEQGRIVAVNRYIEGERPSRIYETLEKSRKWFYKWINRYKNSTGRTKKTWFKDESRVPKRQLGFG